MHNHGNVSSDRARLIGGFLSALLEICSYQIRDRNVSQLGCVYGLGGGGDGFFIVCEDFGRMFDKSFPACAFLKIILWRLARAH